MTNRDLKFVDLFAGIGGFHAALSAMGLHCASAVEIDPKVAAVYMANWGEDARGDITQLAGEGDVAIPDHDVLCAGFPCQPFSKSGTQRGMDETRGTLFWNILRIIQVRKPSMVILENVRNLAGPRHTHEWNVIIETLRDEGYRVSDTPTVFSPHLLPPDLGGRPQVRERVFISATRVDDPTPKKLQAQPVVLRKPVDNWDPRNWKLDSYLDLGDLETQSKYGLSKREMSWINIWDELVQIMKNMADSGELGLSHLPGFPIWADAWPRKTKLATDNLPSWKVAFLNKNAELYERLMGNPDGRHWIRKGQIFGDQVPPSRRKLEWQAQDAGSLWETIMHFRPSGIRAKLPNYIPALVAITQTSIFGPEKRRLSPREAARLQGLPDQFTFGGQSDAATYKQLGNGVAIGAVWYILKKHAERDRDILMVSNPELLKAIDSARSSPDHSLAKWRPASGWLD